MKKKVSLAIVIIFLLILFTQIQPFIDGILAHGWGGTNYGRVIFPLIIMLTALKVHLGEKRKNNS